MWHGRPRGGGRAPRPRQSLVRAGTGHIFAALRVLLSFLRWGLQAATSALLPTSLTQGTSPRPAPNSLAPATDRPGEPLSALTRGGCPALGSFLSCHVTSHTRSTPAPVPRSLEGTLIATWPPSHGAHLHSPTAIGPPSAPRAAGRQRRTEMSPGTAGTPGDTGTVSSS